MAGNPMAGNPTKTLNREIADSLPATARLESVVGPLMSQLGPRDVSLLNRFDRHWLKRFLIVILSASPNNSLRLFQAGLSTPSGQP